MPTFYPEHVPHGLDDFTRGYIGTAEWLWPRGPEEEGGIDRDRVTGWHRSALSRMTRDCRAFQRENAADLATCAEYHDTESLGGDFYLTREGHGAGYWDRFGRNHPAYPAAMRLSEAARAEGGAGYPWLPKRGTLVRLG